MNILFLTNAYPDFDNSHRGVFIKKMAGFLQEKGFFVSVVTPKIYDDSPVYEVQERIKIYRFPFFAGNRLLIEYQRIPYAKMALYFLSGFVATAYSILRNRCHLIHVHWAIPTGLVGVFAGILLQKPVIVTIHGSDFRMAMGGPGVLRRLFLWVCRKAKFITCVSERMKEAIVEMGIDGEKISTFPMGVEDTFLEVGRGRKPGTRIAPPTILSNRNLQPLYDVSQLVRAVPMVLKEEPETRFVIAGDGPCKRSLEEEVRNLQVDPSVQFLGRIPHEKMPHILGGADIYVSTSPCDGTSVSLLEAMAAGAFPIVADIDANREWISDSQNGFLVPVGDEISLAEKIVKTIRTRHLRFEAFEKNRSIVEQRACWGPNIERMTTLYRCAA